MIRTSAALPLFALLACKPQGVPAEQPDDSHSHHHASDPDHGMVNELGYRGHHRFDDPAEWAKEFDSAERTAWQKPDELVASLAVAEDALVADLGAGTGYFAIRLAKAAPQGKVFAVDIEPTMVAWVAERATSEGASNLVSIQGGPSDPALPEPVDLAFMCNVFHHLADPSAYFAEVAKQLRPGGRVVIVDFRTENPDDAPGPPKAMRTSIDQVAGVLGGVGLELVRTDTELLPWQYVLVFAVPS